MNRPIVRLYGLVIVLFALLIGFTSRWAVFSAASLRDNPLNKRGEIAQQRIQRGPITADDGARARPQRARGRRAVLAPLSGRRPVRARRRILGPADRPGRPGAVLRQLSERADEHRPDRDPRPAAGQAAAGRRRQHVAGPERAGRRPARPRRPARCGRRARPPHRRDQGVRERPGLQPGDAEPRDPHPPGPREPARAAGGPRDAGRLSARLDVQGGHRYRRAGQRPLHAHLGAQRRLAEGDLRRAARERRQPELRQHHPHRRADVLGQHGLGAGGRAARQGDDGPLHEPARLRRSAADRSALVRGPAERRVLRRPAGAPVSSRRRARWSTSGAWPSGRTTSR